MVQATRLLGIVLLIQSCYTGESAPIYVNVKIEVNYTAPSTFDREPPYYRAGVPLSLNCTSSFAGRRFYHWTSDCPTNNCFVKDQFGKVVSTDFLRSTDSGVHTCTVDGSREETGSDNITVHVVGAGIYDSFHKVALPNNSLILAGRNLSFICVSGSPDSNVGDVYDNNGTDITISQDDPFFTFQRTTGAIHVKSAHQFSFKSDDQGIYTCRIPDETGSVAVVHVGLYPNGTDVKLDITKMEIKAKEVGLYTVNCTSTHSPATSVTWTRDGVELNTSDSEGMYTSYQEVKEYNRRSSSYHNVLTIRGLDVTGRYRCDIENRYKKTSTTTVIHKLEVTGHETPLIVGIIRHIRCTSFGNTTIMIWHKSTSRTLATSGDSPILDLIFAPEDTSLNNTAFTCKAWTPEYEAYVQKTVLIQVRDFINRVNITGPPDPWLTDNGEPYTLNCVVLADVTPDMKWLDPEGIEVMEDDAHSLEETVSGMYTTLKLTFNKLNTSYAGTYSCISTTLNPPSRNISRWNVTIKHLELVTTDPTTIPPTKSPASTVPTRTSETIALTTIASTPVPGRPSPPIDFQSLCNIIVWGQPFNPSGDIIAYEAQFYIPDTQLRVLRKIAPDRTFYIIDEEDKLGENMDTFVKVRARTQSGPGQWSVERRLGCDDVIVTATPQSCNCPTCPPVPKTMPPLTTVESTPSTSAFFELGGEAYGNNSVVSLTKVGEGRDALLCKTNSIKCCATVPNRFGQFYYPNGVTIPVYKTSHGFYRNRGEQEIRLNRRQGIISPVGKFRCEIPDASGVLQNIFITLLL